jgi:hypothetical protein
LLGLLIKLPEEMQSFSNLELTKEDLNNSFSNFTKDIVKTDFKDRF